MDFTFHNGTNVYAVSISTPHHPNRYHVSIQRLPNDDEVNEQGVGNDDFFGFGHDAEVQFYNLQSAYMYACAILYDQTTDPDPEP